MSKVLKLADKSKIKSVVFPLMGSGALKIPIHVWAKGTQDGIIDFVMDKDGDTIHWKEVQICIFDIDMKEEFTNLWKQCYSEVKEEEKKLEMTME